MNKILPVLAFLLASDVFAQDVGCKATARGQWATKVTTLDLKDQGNDVYVDQKVEGYEIYVRLSNYKINRIDYATIIIKKEGVINSMISGNLSTSKKIALKYHDQPINTDLIIECEVVK